MLAARVTGHVSWWVFVVARLMSVAGPDDGRRPAAPLRGLRRRFRVRDRSRSSGLRLDRLRAPDRPATVGLSDPFYVANVLATVTVAALAVTVIAALFEVVLERRWLLGVGTVIAPVIGAVIILTALYERAGYLGGGHLDLPVLVVFALVLLGVAIREVWSRVWAMKLTAPVDKNRLWPGTTRMSFGASG